MRLVQEEGEAEEEVLRRALHMSRVEAHRICLAGTRHALRVGGEREVAGQPRSLTIGPITLHADGPRTHFPPPLTRFLELIPGSEPNSSAPVSEEKE